MKRILFLTLFFSFNSAFAATFVSHSPGNWNGGLATWTVIGVDPDNIPDGDDDVIISTGTSITWGQSSVSRCQTLTVQNGANLIGPNNTTFQLRIFGDYTNDGTESGRGIFSFQNTPSLTISGSGTFASGAIWNIRTNITVESDVTKTHFYWFRIYNGADVTNRGNMTVNTQVRTSHASTVFTNEGTLTIRSQEFFTLGAGATFDASPVGNTVVIDWLSASSVNIPTPTTSFHNLTINPPHAARAIGNLDINGDLNIADDAVFNLFNNDHTLAGDWISNGGNVTNGNSFTFDGAAQNISITNRQYEIIPCNTTISASSSLTISDSLSIEGDLTIDGAFDVTASNFGVAIAGDWTNNGSFNAQNGCVHLVGSSLQNINGSTDFNSLTLNNSNGAAITGGTFTLARTLSVDAGDFNTNNNSFTILSDATSTGNIGNLCGTCSVSGTVIMQRFIGAGNANYRDMASPFAAGVNFTDWDDELIMSGPGFPDGCAWGGGCYVSCKFYDAATQTYQDISSVSDPITNLVGYEIFLGDNLNTFSGVTLVTTGTVNGPADINYVCPLDFSLVGNPYCSDFDFDQLFAGSNVGDFYYIFDASTGNYEFYNSATQSSSGNVNSNGIISSGQGFWVYGIGGGAFSRTLSFRQNAKRDSGVPLVKSLTSPLAEEISFKVTNKSNDYSCKSFIAFSDFASNETDSMDIKMFNGPARPSVNNAPLAWFENGLDKLRYNSVENDNVLRKEFTFFFKSEISGRFEISAEELSEFDQFNCVLLYDRELNKMIDLRSDNYTFEYSGDSNSSDRFNIILSNETMCDVLLADDKTTVEDKLTVHQLSENRLKIENLISDNDFDAPQELNIKLFNSQGKLVYTGKISAYEDEISIPNLNSGIYLIVVGNNTTKLFIK